MKEIYLSFSLGAMGFDFEVGQMDWKEWTKEELLCMWEQSQLATNEIMEEIEERGGV